MELLNLESYVFMHKKITVTRTLLMLGACFLWQASLFGMVASSKQLAQDAWVSLRKHAKGHPYLTAVIAIPACLAIVQELREWHAHRLYAHRQQSLGQNSQLYGQELHTAQGVIFSHGLEANAGQVLGYQHLFPTTIDRVHTFGYYDEIQHASKFGTWQQRHVHVLSDQWDMAMQAGKAGVLFGFSRGASAIINYIGQSWMHGEKACMAQALVLHAPYDSVRSGADNKIGRYLGGLAHALIVPLLLPHYSTVDIQPCDMVRFIPNHMPVLLVCSKQDMLIPYQCSVRLYKQLRAQGNTNAHLLVLDDGDHNEMLNHPENIDMLQRCHATFYRHYKLEAGPELTVGEKGLLADMQPSNPELQALYGI